MIKTKLFGILYLVFRICLLFEVCYLLIIVLKNVIDKYFANNGQNLRNKKLTENYIVFFLKYQLILYTFK